MKLCRNILLLIILIKCTSTKAFSQVGTFSFDKMNVAFQDLDNPLTITIPKSITTEGIPHLSTPEGNFEFVDSSSTKFNTTFKYIGRFKKTGEHQITIKSDATVLFTYDIRCKPIPNPEFKLDLKYESGIVSKEIIKSAIGIAAVLGNFDFYYIFKTKSYKCSIIKKGKLFKEFECTQVKFTDEMKSIFQKLNSNDIILFEEIKVIEESGKVRTIPSVNYRIE